MGLGIAYVSAVRAKVSVAITDKSQAQVASGLVFFEKLLKKDIERGRIKSEEAKEARDRIQVVPDIRGMRDADMVIEVCYCHVSCALFSCKPRLCLKTSLSNQPFFATWLSRSAQIPSWPPIRRPSPLPK